MKSKVEITVDLNNSKLVDKLLGLQELDTQIDIVLRKNKMCSNCVQSDAVLFNKKMNLPLNSKVGMLMSLGKNIEL